jgi:transposase
MRRSTVGRPAKLSPAQAAEIREAFKLRRSLANKNLARKYGIATNSVSKYGLGLHKGVWYG